MDAVSELELRLTDFANYVPNFHPSMIETVSSIYTGDHGKGTFQFETKLVVRTREEDGLKKWPVVYPLADVKCKKDAGKIFKATVHKNLAAGVDKIVHSNIKFEQIEVDEVTTWKYSLIKKYTTDLDSTSDLVREVEAFMIGNLKLLSMMLGKENVDGN